VAEVRKKGRRRLLVATGVVALVAATAAGIVAANKANAAPTTVSASTVVSNHPDNDNGGVAFYDDYTRALTVTLDSPQPTTTPGGDLAYTATVTDTGQFHAILGALTPNQSTAGLKIAHAVGGSMNGGISYTIVAPSTDTLTGAVPATENDNFAAPTGDQTTGDWPAQAFTVPASAVVTEDSTWSWTYKTACETWVDSSSNGDGNLAADGNITGKICVVPHVYDVSAKYLAATREYFYFKDTLTGQVKVEIYGPGPINKHIWYINVKGGLLNTGVITGLTYHRDYTMNFTPFAHGRQIPGTRVVTTSFTS